MQGAKNALISGSVGIGTTSPSFKLDVAGNLRSFGSASNDINVETTGGTNAWARLNMKTTNQQWVLGTSQNFNGDQLYLFDLTNNLPRMTIQPNGGVISFPTGMVGIGTTNPGATLDVDGQLRLGFPDVNGDQPLCIINSNHHIATCQASSLRYKTNIRPFRSGLDILNRLHPISFNWRKDMGGQRDVGLGAEDVAQVAPAFIYKNKEGEPEGVRYDRLSILLINAIKEQQQEIEQLKSRVRKLQAAAPRRRVQKIKPGR